MELRTTTGFFMLMGVGGTFKLELAFEPLVGRRVAVLWVGVDHGVDCLLMIDGWARRWTVTSDFFPDWHRPGKWLVDTVITLSNERR
jgi:hypothetical protein